MKLIMNNRQIWVYDIETLSNCFTYTARNIDTKELVQYVIWYYSLEDERNDIEDLVKHLKSVRGQVGVNNLDFDYPVLHYILNEYTEWECFTVDEMVDSIYEKAQSVIKEEWSSIKDQYVKIPQLDLFKIWHYDNYARMTSLKKLQIALRYDNVQDMPYKHTDTITTQQQVQEILDYNLNDVDSTLDFYLKTTGKIELRRGIHKKYGLNCMNFPDSKIGEDLTLKLYCSELGVDEKIIRKKRTHRKEFNFSECIPKYINFTTDNFKDLLSYLSSIKVTELKGSFKYSFNYKGFIFDLGTGGIHGSIKSGVYESTDTHILVDVDVASLYPSLAIVNKLYPKHLGKEFLDVYEYGLLKPRLEAKKNGDKVMNTGFKLSLNSVYGKSNSEYSWLYDPLYTLKTTLAGQLSLCMLSEMLMSNMNDLTMLQINTDGLTVKIPKDQKNKLYELCKQWENKTGLTLEYALYKKMIIRDVNNYIALDTDGKVKSKGAFKTYAETIRDEEYHKSLSQTIVTEALHKYFLENIPVEDTIKQCTNIYDFCKTFRAIGDWYCDLYSPEIDESIPTQKTNRYYISTEGLTLRKHHVGEKYGHRIIEVEAGGNKVKLLNKYVKKDSFSDYKVDYNYYIAECYKIIHKIDGTKERLARESKEKKEKEKIEKQEEKFIKFCIMKQPTQKQYDMYVKDWLVEKYGNPKVKIN